jgi:hypothetical protein
MARRKSQAKGPRVPGLKGNAGRNIPGSTPKEPYGGPRRPSPGTWRTSRKQKNVMRGIKGVAKPTGGSNIDRPPAHDHAQRPGLGPEEHIISRKPKAVIRVDQSKPGESPRNRKKTGFRPRGGRRSKKM